MKDWLLQKQFGYHVGEEVDEGVEEKDKPQTVDRHKDIAEMIISMQL